MNYIQQFTADEKAAGICIRQYESENKDKQNCLIEDKTCMTCSDLISENVELRKKLETMELNFNAISEKFNALINSS